MTEQCQITSEDSIDPEEIPQLEEYWDNSQFDDADINLINRHNTHSENERNSLIYQTINIITKRVP